MNGYFQKHKKIAHHLTNQVIGPDVATAGMSSRQLNKGSS